jgi:hypothetical protein
VASRAAAWTALPSSNCSLKAHKPDEFGVKVSVATSVFRSKGGQFVAHVQALPGNPYDGHNLAKVIPAIKAQLGNSPSRFIAMSDIGGTRPRPPAASGFTPQARSEASPNRSGASYGADPPSAPCYKNTACCHTFSSPIDAQQNRSLMRIASADRQNRP